MTPGQPWVRPESQNQHPGLAALVSLLLHTACLAGVIGLFNRASPTEPAPERGVEIVWDEEAAEAVSEAEAPALPGAPPEPAAPPLAEAPSAPEPPPPAPPMVAPPPPMTAMAPPPPAPLDLPPLDLPMPDLRVATPPEAPPEPPQEVAAELPLPEPPPPTPPPPEARRTPQREARTPQRSQPQAESSRSGEEAAAQTAAGIGRATGAVVPPGPDTRYQNAAPSYPEAARLRGEQGTVELELAVGADGRVTAVTVARSSGSPMLDAAARRAVRDWRFRPAMRDGEAVPGTITTRVRFQLQ